MTLGVPSSPGVPAGLAEHTITLSFNDIDGVRAAFAELGDQVACVIVEPIAGNMNMVKPVDGFHEALREECTKAGALLVFSATDNLTKGASGGALQNMNLICGLPETMGLLPTGGAALPGLSTVSAPPPQAASRAAASTPTRALRRDR